MAAFAYYSNNYATTATSTTVVIRITTGIATGSNTIFIQQPPDPKEARRRLLFALTQEAIQEARETLRKVDDDPSGLLPRRPRGKAYERLHVRPRSKGRVCAGSSRYRVLWN